MFGLCNRLLLLICILDHVTNSVYTCHVTNSEKYGCYSL